MKSALDLGAGCGVQALLSASHAERVVATDINRRALAITTLNALLNDLSNVEVRQGDLFEGAKGEKFNLIVSNPPFVVSPDREFLFRDSPLPRDELSRSVVAQAAHHLESGGFATILVNWIQSASGNWRDAPTGWIDATGCDALLIHYSTEDPRTYAQRWSTQVPDVGAARQGTALERWLTYYRKEGIEAIASGAIVLRSPAGAPWAHAMQLECGPSADAGEHIESIFAGRDYLASLTSDDAAWGHVFRLTTGTRFDHSGTFLVRPEGLGLRGHFPPWFADLLWCLDGRRTLGEISDEAARENGRDEAARRSEAIRTVRGLIESGFLEHDRIRTMWGSRPRADLATRVDSDLVDSIR